MTGFNAEWLALREPYDHGARDGDLVIGLDRSLGSEPVVRILDLGCGAGSNLRYLAPRLAFPQTWCLVDNDSAMLDTLSGSAGFDRKCHAILQHDLNALDGVPFDGVHAVVASALMDLVSPAWFQKLAERCRRAGAALLAALDYDGRLKWHPVLRDDDWIEALFNVHQRGDKGFGPAMGPAATGLMSDILTGLGYRVLTAPTPWDLGPHDAVIQCEFIAGVVAACLEASPGERERIMAWSERRRRTVGKGHSRLLVGHDDLLALPPGTQA